MSLPGIQPSVWLMELRLPRQEERVAFVPGLRLNGQFGKNPACIRARDGYFPLLPSRKPGGNNLEY